MLARQERERAEGLAQLQSGVLLRYVAQLEMVNTARADLGLEPVPPPPLLAPLLPKPAGASDTPP